MIPVFCLLLALLPATGCASPGRESTEKIAASVEPSQPDFATGPVTGLSRLKILPVDAGPKSVELMPGGDRIFVNDLYAHENFIFDANTYEKLKVIALPDEPVETDFSPDGKIAWVSLYNSSKVLMIDTGQGIIAGEVAAGNIPKEIAASPDGKWVYVANWESNTVTVIDAEARQRLKEIPIYATPRGICFSNEGDLAYVCVMGGDTIAEIDVAAGHVVRRQIYCGENPRHAVLSPDGGTIYVSNNIPGTVTVLDRVSGEVKSTIKVGNRARTIAITPDGDYLFVCNYDDGTVGCVDLQANEQIFTCKTSRPIGMTVDARGERLFVSNYAPPQITVLHIDRAGPSQSAP
jgi:YVTN family beta-propeller protein